MIDNHIWYSGNLRGLLIWQVDIYRIFLCGEVVGCNLVYNIAINREAAKNGVIETNIPVARVVRLKELQPLPNCLSSNTVIMTELPA